MEVAIYKLIPLFRIRLLGRAPGVWCPIMRGITGNVRLEPRFWGQGSIPGYTEKEVDQFQSSCMDRNTIITMKLTSFHN